MFLKISDFLEIFKEFIDEYNTKLKYYIDTEFPNDLLKTKLNNLSTELCAKLHVLGIFVKIQEDYGPTLLSNRSLEDIQTINNLLAKVNLVWNDLKYLYNFF